MTEDSRYIERIPNRSMTHTDPDIAEILERFKEEFGERGYIINPSNGKTETIIHVRKDIKDFLARECLALKKKWEREHFDNQ